MALGVITAGLAAASAAKGLYDSFQSPEDGEFITPPAIDVPLQHELMPGNVTRAQVANRFMQSPWRTVDFGQGEYDPATMQAQLPTFDPTAQQNNPWMSGGTSAGLGAYNYIPPGANSHFNPQGSFPGLGSGMQGGAFQQGMQPQQNPLQTPFQGGMQQQQATQQQTAGPNPQQNQQQGPAGAVQFSAPNPEAQQQQQTSPEASQQQQPAAPQGQGMPMYPGMNPMSMGMMGLNPMDMLQPGFTVYPNGVQTGGFQQVQQQKQQQSSTGGNQ